MSLPSAIDNSIYLPPIRNQGSIGSCVGWAVSNLAAGLENDDQSGRVVLSPGYLYGRTLEWENGSFGDGLQLVADALSVASKEGVATEKEVPYSETTQYAGGARHSAYYHRIDSWETLRNYWGSTDIVENTKRALVGNDTPPGSAGFAVIAFEVRTDFDAVAGVASNGYYKWNGTSPVRGYHAMCVCGYDDARQAFRVANSWGANRGDDGYLWIDYQTYRSLVKEAYTAYDDERRAWSSQVMSHITQAASAGDDRRVIELYWFNNDGLSVPVQVRSVRLNAADGFSYREDPYNYWSAEYFVTLPSVPSSLEGETIDLDLTCLDGTQQTLTINCTDGTMFSGTGVGSASARRVAAPKQVPPSRHARSAFASGAH